MKIYKKIKLEKSISIKANSTVFLLEKGDVIRVPIHKEFIKEVKNTKQIKVKNPGVLEIPKNKNFWDMPLSHFIDLAKSKGKKEIMSALLNLERWNKNDNPNISKKARNIIDKLKKNSDWNKI